MQRELVQAARDWLENAQEDLETAALVNSAEPPKRRAAVFHAQQAAEKALKAYLTLYDEPFDWTHRLGVLLNLCVKFDPAFTLWRETAEVLTPYVTRFRYPPPPGTPQVPSTMRAMPSVERANCSILSWIASRRKPDHRAMSLPPIRVER